MKIWKEVFHSFSKAIVLHLNQISGGLGSWVVYVVYSYRPLQPITAAGRVRALLYTLAKKGALDFYVIKCTSYLPKQGRWFSPGTPASSTTKTGRHDIAEKLLQWHKTPFKQTNKKKSKYQVEHENGSNMINQDELYLDESDGRCSEIFKICPRERWRWKEEKRLKT